MVNIYDFLTFRQGQKVFVVIKPGFLQYSGEIIDILKSEGWVVERIINKKLLPKEARAMYKVHKDEPFYKDLCKYMCSGISQGIILKYVKGGLDKPFKAMAKIKDDIRKKYGESDMRNVMHSSDSESNMLNEAGIYFNL